MAAAAFANSVRVFGSRGMALPRRCGTIRATLPSECACVLRYCDLRCVMMVFTAMMARPACGTRRRSMR